MKQNSNKPFQPSLQPDYLLQQITNISKAHAYDIVSKQAAELLEENKTLKNRVKYLEALINEYGGKISAVSLSGPKVKNFLGECIPDNVSAVPDDRNDIPPEMFVISNDKPESDCGNYPEN